MVQIGLCPVRSIPSIMVVVRANFIVAENIRKSSASGNSQFQGKTFPSMDSLSNARTQDDRGKGGHGMAIKLMQVPGEKTSSWPGTRAKPRIFYSWIAPTFFIKNAIEFAEFDAARLKSLSSRFPKLSLIVGYFSKASSRFPRLLKIEGNYSPNPLATKYWSATPYKLGTSAVKYMVAPRDECIAHNGPA